MLRGMGQVVHICTSYRIVCVALKPSNLARFVCSIATVGKKLRSFGVPTKGEILARLHLSLTHHETRIMADNSR